MMGAAGPGAGLREKSWTAPSCASWSRPFSRLLRFITSATSTRTNISGEKVGIPAKAKLAGSSAHGITDAEDPRIEEPDDVARIGLRDRFTVARLDQGGLRKPQLLARANVDREFANP